MKLLQRLKNWLRGAPRENPFVEDGEVIDAIRSIPPHFSGGDVLWSLAVSDWWLREDFPTGTVSTDFWGIRRVKVGSGAETNTLSRPNRAGILLVLVSTSNGGGTRAITHSPGIDSTHTVITFSAAKQTAFLFSVPDSTQGTFRWQFIAGDAALS